MNSRIIASALCGLWLAGCSTIPLSFIEDHQVTYKTVINRYPLAVEAVDGVYVQRGSTGGVATPVPIAPGTHQVLFSAPPPEHERLPIEKTYPMTIAACTRYYVAADRASPLRRDWTLVIEASETVGGCNPAEEEKKAAAAQAAVQSSSLVGAARIDS